MSRLERHERHKQRLSDAIARAGARPGQPFACPYLPGRAARHVALRLEPPQPGLYHALMDPKGLPLAIVVVILWAVEFWYHKKAFEGILSA